MMGVRTVTIPDVEISRSHGIANNQKERIYAHIFLKSLAVGEFYTASYTIIMHTLLHY
jgi:hypothetical protein